jgi:hypothetical protein
MIVPSVVGEEQSRQVMNSSYTVGERTFLCTVSRAAPEAVER